MNLTAAYRGAMKGFTTSNRTPSRPAQIAIVTALARWRQRGIVSDGEVVSTEDLLSLKPVKGKKELK